MAVEIKGGGSTDIAQVGAVNKALRVELYDENGAYHNHQPVEVTCNPSTAVGDDLIQSLDVGIYKFLSLQLTGTWVGTVTFQQSNDNGTWSDVVAQKSGDVLNPYVTSVSSNLLIKIPTLAKYARVRVVSYTSGIIEGTCYAYKEVNDTGQISSTGEIVIAANQTVGLDAGTNTIGTVKVTPAITDNPIYQNVISAVGVNSTLVQAGQSNMGILHIVSTAATPRYLKFYNKATAPIVGTDIPLFTIALATGASPFVLPALVGINFSLGLAFAIVLGVEDSSTTPFTVAGEVTALIAYT